MRTALVSAWDVGNPIRFLGAGAPIDLEEEGSIPPRCAVVATFRTHDQQFLMRPSAEVNEILLGCLGRAHDRYREMPLHAVALLSNHGDLLLSPPSFFVMWSFMRDFSSTASTRLNRVPGVDVNRDNVQHRAPLAQAAAITALIEGGANIEAVTELGHTPLLKAAMEGKDANAAILSAAGARREPLDIYGLSASAWAAHEGVPALAARIASTSLQGA